MSENFFDPSKLDLGNNNSWGEGRGGRSLARIDKRVSSTIRVWVGDRSWRRRISRGVEFRPKNRARERSLARGISGGVSRRRQRGKIEREKFDTVEANFSSPSSFHPGERNPSRTSPHVRFNGWVIGEGGREGGRLDQFISFFLIFKKVYFNIF